MSPPMSAGGVNLDEVSQLVDQLERDLAKARAGNASVETLRAEVEQLRALLNTESPSHGEVQQGLHGVRARIREVSDELGDDLKSGALTGSDYLTRIGRMLGLG